MLSIWQLPQRAVIGGSSYELHADYRDILEIFSYMADETLPEFLRWQIALGLFYDQPIPEEHQGEAMEYLCGFISCGKEQDAKPGPKLLDWQLDADLIAADVNKTAGQEIRALPFVHWWTFMAWFHAIGEGQLSTVVAIRDKLRRGKKLEKWEREFYRENKDRIQMRKPLTREEKQHKARLEEMLR